MPRFYDLIEVPLHNSMHASRFGINDVAKYGWFGKGGGINGRGSGVCIYFPKAIFSLPHTHWWIFYFFLLSIIIFSPKALKMKIQKWKLYTPSGGLVRTGRLGVEVYRRGRIGTELQTCVLPSSCPFFNTIYTSFSAPTGCCNIFWIVFITFIKNVYVPSMAFLNLFGSSNYHIIIFIFPKCFVARK